MLIRSHDLGKNFIFECGFSQALKRAIMSEVILKIDHFMAKNVFFLQLNKLLHFDWAVIWPKLK